MEPPTERPTPSSPAPWRDGPARGWDDERPAGDLRALRAHRLLVTLVTLAALGGGLLALALRPTTYHARADVLVTPLAQDDDSLLGLPLVRDLGDPIRTIQTAAAAADNRDIAQVAATRLGAPWTAERVQRTVDVAPKGQTNILEVVASASVARTAADVANTYAHSLIDTRQATLRRLADSSARAAQARLDALRSQPGGAGQQSGDAAGQQSVTAAGLEQRLVELGQVRDSGDPTMSLLQDAAVPRSAAGAPAWLVLTISTLAGLVLGAAAAITAERLARARRGRQGSAWDDGSARTVSAGTTSAGVMPAGTGSAGTVPAADTAAADGASPSPGPQASTVDTQAGVAPTVRALDGQPTGPAR
ncbi:MULTISPECIES: hypothetical protein [Protofrankia]|uniref:Chain length determinant protein n=1 Tax=Protofrankia coriariae TaxID=1562887 RepID=A0ABR5F129_9ACTN|nr:MULTISPECIES: hypothetical protein [Protofrankia]KLL10410.1 hypothetical protein FrCorBMG51_18075 [Protofrankia coriariae]